MACRDQRVGAGGQLTKFLSVAAICLLCIFASACSAGASGRDASDAASDLSELVGKEVMISFRWSKPTSVLESLALVGMLVRVEEDVLVVDVEKSVRSEEQGQVVDALERHGKLNRDPEGHWVYVLRKKIADLRLHPRI